MPNNYSCQNFGLFLLE